MVQKYLNSLHQSDALLSFHRSFLFYLNKKQDEWDQYQYFI
jgi:hypothetical protein